MFMINPSRLRKCLEISEGEIIFLKELLTIPFSEKEFYFTYIFLYRMGGIGNLDMHVIDVI